MAQPSAPPRDPTEVLGRRFAAFVIDAFFLAVVGGIALASTTHQNLVEAPPDACSTRVLRDASLCWQIGDRVLAWGSDAVFRSVVILVVVAFLDLVVLQTLTGASIGKLCVGLRVVEVQGNEARFLRVLGRWLFLIVDLGILIVGVVTTLLTHPHRRVGDLVCGTYVVGVASVGHRVVVLPPPPPAFGTSPSPYGAPPGSPVPPGWGTPAPWATVAPPATIATPPGTSPTTPGEWGAVARPGPALVRSPQWEAPPPADQPVPVARDNMAPQWATPPGRKPEDPAEPEQHAVAEPMPAPEAAPESLAAAPQWSPVVPRTTKDDTGDAEPDAVPISPPPPPPSPWSPVVPGANGDPTPPPEPPPEPPTEPSPPPPTEPEPPPPAAAHRPDAEPESEPDDDVPWWDSDG